MVSQVLIVMAAAIILTLGLIHLLYTFGGSKLHPRDPELAARMSAASPVISRETTMWKAWIGFNASHSFGAMLFGAIYGFLALAHPGFLFESAFLCIVGLVLLAGYVALGKVYWFSVPFRGIALAAVCYTAGLIIAWI
ncbi:MAG: LIC_13387 family protein [Steroidobacter sp.]